MVCDVCGLCELIWEASSSKLCSVSAGVDVYKREVLGLGFRVCGLCVRV